MTIDLDGGAPTRQAKKTSPAAAQKSAAKQEAADEQPSGQTLPDDSFGPGGREYVRYLHLESQTTKTRKPRAGDEKRPRCKACSDDKTAVLLTAASTQSGVTYYKCLFCGHTHSVLNPQIAAALGGGKVAAASQPIVRRP